MWCIYTCDINKMITSGKGISVADASTFSTMSDEEQYLYDLQGFLVMSGVF